MGQESMQSSKRKEVATKTARRATGRMNEAKSKPKRKVRQKAKPRVIEEKALGRIPTFIDA
jgi:hypothetical protein